MEPLYLIDGSGYIFRAFFAVQPLSTKAGLPTNALFGFTRMIIKLLKDCNAKYIAVTFDTGKPTFRHQRYTEYKAHRPDCPPELVQQMPYFRKIVRALGIQSLEKEGFEADDIIATLARKLRSPDQKVIIVSGDKDLAQLVEDNIELWDAMRDIRYNALKVEEKFGVRPNQIIDFLSLTGDASDNIPGVKGIGPKTAQILIRELGGVEALLAEPGKIETLKDLRGAAGIRQKIESSLEMLRLSRELVTLDDRVDPYFSVDAVSSYEWPSVKGEELIPLFEELEFSSLLSSLPFPMTLPTLGTSTASAFGIIEAAKKRYSTITPETLESFAKKLSGVSAFAFDTETTSLDVRNCKLVGISISWEPEVAYFLPLGSEIEPVQNLDATRVKSLLADIFRNPKIKKYGANLKFDVHVLTQHGYEVNGLAFDTMLASFLLHPDRGQHGLKALSQEYLHEHMASFKEIVGDAPSIAHVPMETVSRYACADADASFRLVEPLQKAIDAGSKGPEAPSLRFAFEQIDMPLVSVLQRMEAHGIKIDVAFLTDLGNEFKTELQVLEEAIYQLANGPFNINSPKQLGEVLFEKLGLPTHGIRKTTHGYSTGADILAKLAEHHPIIAKIQEYRELFKLNSTYIEALKTIADPQSNRIHTSFNQAIAATGRLSSTDPNLQNIPIKTARGRRIRQAFIAGEGNTLIAADYSQIELRLLAHLSGDGTLIRAFQNDEDIHFRTACELFGEMIVRGERKSEFRRIAKTINFGIIYGMGAFRLASELKISRREAQRFIDDYFARYPNVRRYFDELERQSTALGYVETVFGRRRYAAEIDTGQRDSGYVQRSLMNFPLQGSAAEIIKLAMIQIDQKLVQHADKAAMLLQVHDELVFEVAEGQAESVREFVQKEMEGAAKLLVPLKVDISLGKSWGTV